MKLSKSILGSNSICINQIEANFLKCQQYDAYILTSFYFQWIMFTKTKREHEKENLHFQMAIILAFTSYHFVRESAVIGYSFIVIHEVLSVSHKIVE